VLYVQSIDVLLVFVVVVVIVVLLVLFVVVVVLVNCHYFMSTYDILCTYVYS
jgi:hypothetical protein